MARIANWFLVQIIN